ncbi:MAG: DMT family transporter [Fidelibacterota bacterium]
MRPKVVVLYTVLILIWSTTWMVLKISLEGTPPILGVALRFAMSAAILWAVFLQRGEKLVLTPTALKVYVGFGALNFASSYSLTYWGTQFIYSGLSAVLWATLPILVAFLAHFMLPDDPLTPKKTAGIVAALGGTTLIFAQGGVSPETFKPIGVAAVWLAVALAAWPNVYYKRHQKDIPSFHVNVVAQTLAAGLLLPLSFLLEEPGAMEWNLVNISALFYLTIFGTIITWSIYLWLFSQITVTQITAVALVPPLMASFLGWLFLGERFTPTMIGGSILVLVGVFVVNMQQR